MESLEKLPNIGAILADRLRDAGVRDAAELRRLGAAAAFAKIRAELPADASWEAASCKIPDLAEQLASALVLRGSLIMCPQKPGECVAGSA